MTAIACIWQKQNRHGYLTNITRKSKDLNRQRLPLSYSPKTTIIPPSIISRIISIPHPTSSPAETTPFSSRPPQTLSSQNLPLHHSPLSSPPPMLPHCRDSRQHPAARTPSCYLLLPTLPPPILQLRHSHYLKYRCRGYSLVSTCGLSDGRAREGWAGKSK